MYLVPITCLVFSYHSFYDANQLGFGAGKAGLEFMLDNQVEAQVQRKAVIVDEFIRKEILPLDERLSHRGIGLMWGIDCSKLGGDAFSEAIVDTCFQKKLIIERAGRDSSVVKIMPPLVIEDELLVQGLQIVKEAFIEALKK